MGDSILSQAEIDALLNGDSEVKDEPTASVSGESDIRPYDPEYPTTGCARTFAGAGNH